jgi:magnesium chelatase family protein
VNSPRHAGALFLDEFAEFQPQVLDTLREPLEEGAIMFSRRVPR